MQINHTNIPSMVELGTPKHKAQEELEDENKLGLKHGTRTCS
jgi:hypothetical protein